LLTVGALVKMLKNKRLILKTVFINFIGLKNLHTVC